MSRAARAFSTSNHTFNAHVRASKSEAGTNRRASFAAPLVPILGQAFLRHGRPSKCRVLGRVAVINSRLTHRADRA
jgi:hypothetical protein